jgi:hypothetical protein
MEAYKKQTEKAVRRFLHHEITFPECISALDGAFARLIRRLTRDQIAPLRAVMLANNERVMKEMERRERTRKANAKNRQSNSKRSTTRFSIP